MSKSNSISNQLSNHLTQVYYGGNWTWSNLKDQLNDVDWKMACTEIEGFNSILKLTFHIHYFVGVQLEVLKGNPLNGKDAESWLPPEMFSENDWTDFKQKIFDEANEMIQLVASLEESKWWLTFEKEKYGTYYRNIMGMIEHTHYHLGQIVILKKLIQLK